MQFKRRSNFSALVYMSKIIMHRVIIIALYIVYCKWYSTWYAFYKQVFVDRVEVLIVKESNCVEYIDEFLSLYFNFIDIDTKPYYILHLLFPSGACSDLRFSCLGKNLKYPVFILIKSILSYYDIGRLLVWEVVIT